MKKTVLTRALSLGLVTLFLGAAINTSAAPENPNASDRAKAAQGLNLKKVTVEDRAAAVDALQEKLDDLGLQALPVPGNFGEVWDSTGYLVPDYFGAANWAYSPPAAEIRRQSPWARRRQRQ